MTTRIITRRSQKSMFFKLVSQFFCFSTVFSTIQLVAWNFNFATAREQMKWRICSLATTLAPTAISGFLQLSSIWDPKAHSNLHEKAALPELAALVILCYFTSLLAYFIARLILIFQIFYCLRLMPIDIYSDAAWINYIPRLKTKCYDKKQRSCMKSNQSFIHNKRRKEKYADLLATYTVKIELLASAELIWVIWSCMQTVNGIGNCPRHKRTGRQILLPIPKILCMTENQFQQYLVPYRR